MLLLLLQGVLWAEWSTLGVLPLNFFFYAAVIRCRLSLQTSDGSAGLGIQGTLSDGQRLPPAISWKLSSGCQLSN